MEFYFCDIIIINAQKILNIYENTQIHAIFNVSMTNVLLFIIVQNMQKDTFQ